MEIMNIEYRLPSLSEYNKLRSVVGWDGADEQAASEALRHSLFSVVALDGDAVIGCGRVVGDGGLYFYIQDLIVHPDYQHRGCGKLLMTELMSFVKKKARSGAFIGLMAAEGLGKYYESFGFRERHPKAPGMYQIIR